MSGRASHHRPADPRTGRLYRVVAPVGAPEPPPAALKTARLDNLALVPASLLPYKEEWRAIANALPAGDILIVLPRARSRSRKALEGVAGLIRANGHGVTTLQAERFG